MLITQIKNEPVIIVSNDGESALDNFDVTELIDKLSAFLDTIEDIDFVPMSKSSLMIIGLNPNQRILEFLDDKCSKVYLIPLGGQYKSTKNAKIGANVYGTRFLECRCGHEFELKYSGPTKVREQDNFTYIQKLCEKCGNCYNVEIPQPIDIHYDESTPTENP